MRDAPATVALRIDVDFVFGARQGVPYLLEALRRYGMRATFFVPTGSNPIWRTLLRIRRRGHLRRLASISAGQLLKRVSPAALLSTRSILPSLLRAHPTLAQTLERDGHELGVHGHNHAWWADRVWVAPAKRVEREIHDAYACAELAAFPLPLPWASPNWRTRDEVTKALLARGAPYLSECWGHTPFVTVSQDSSEIPLPHLPVTEPSLERLSATPGKSTGEAAVEVVDRIEAKPYAMLCCHDYFEGVFRRDLFEAVLERMAARGIRSDTLGTVATRLSPKLADLPRCCLTRGRIAGFSGLVSKQGAPGPP